MDSKINIPFKKFKEEDSAIFVINNNLQKAIRIVLWKSRNNQQISDSFDLLNHLIESFIKMEELSMNSIIFEEEEEKDDNKLEVIDEDDKLNDDSDENDQDIINTSDMYVYGEQIEIEKNNSVYIGDFGEQKNKLKTRENEGNHMKIWFQFEICYETSIHVKNNKSGQKLIQNTKKVIKVEKNVPIVKTRKSSQKRV